MFSLQLRSHMPLLKTYITALLTTFFVAGFAQQNYYWVKFKDKSNSPYTIDNPSAFLSAKAIARREKQAIPITESDLPVTPAYLQALAPYITQQKHALKWFNMAVVKIDNPAFIDSIRALSFVDTLAGIEYIPHKSMLQNNKFESVETLPDQKVVYPNEYGIAYRQAVMLNADLLHQLGYRGKGITIAHFDNGCLNVNTLKAYDSIRSRILHTYDYVADEADVYNDGGHGSNTLSCIAANMPGKYIGTAPDASFYLLTTEDDNAEWVMEEYNWAAGAQWADSAGADLFTTSLGYTEFDNGIGNHTYQDMTGDKTVITRAANMAFQKGILVFNSAGNSGAGAWRYISAPADGQDVIAVGAVDSAEVLGNFSSRGPTYTGVVKPDVCAQGVRSAVINTSGDLGYSGGTSFSCPVMAGGAACLMQAFPDKTVQEIRNAILWSCDRYNTPDNDYGYGVPDLYNAYLYLKNNSNEKILRVGDNAIVYPNPFINSITISVMGKENVPRKVELFDINGQQLYVREFLMRDKTFELIPAEDLTTLPAGVYVLRLDGKKEWSRTLVKAK